MSKRKKILIGIGVVVAVIAVAGIVFIRGLLSFDTSEEAGVSFETVQSSRPEDSTCLNQAGAVGGVAKELVHTLDSVVVINNGERVIADEEWESYSPRLPYIKNEDRNTLFSDHCFYRSPDAPADCQGDECRISREADDLDWLELARVRAQDCLPSQDAGCSALSADPGAISVTVTSKCHQIIFTGEIYDLADPEGNRYVMHATETGTPNLDVALPDGWTLETVVVDEPLEVLPFGGGDDCFHNVLRDNLTQGYHQYVFANDTYPPNS